MHSTENESAKVGHGTINGHEWVDLGLSVKWATCNVGASNPSEDGKGYAWGKTSAKDEFTEENCKTYGENVGDITGDSNYDAARANWGDTWRMPTMKEMEELVEKCTWTWATQDNIYGYRVAGSNGNSIFLPATEGRGSRLYENGLYCDYWSSTPDLNEPDHPYCIFFNSHEYRVYQCVRPWGNKVRPVTE